MFGLFHENFYDCPNWKILRIRKHVDSLWESFQKWFWYSSCYQRCSIIKGVLKNFAKFTQKHLCRSLFFNKVAGLALTSIPPEISYQLKKSIYQFYLHLLYYLFLVSLLALEHWIHCCLILILTAFCIPRRKVWKPLRYEGCLNFLWTEWKNPKLTGPCYYAK